MQTLDDDVHLFTELGTVQDSVLYCVRYPFFGSTATPFNELLTGLVRQIKLRPTNCGPDAPYDTARPSIHVG